MRRLTLCLALAGAVLPARLQAQETETYILRSTTPALAFTAETESYSMNATVGAPFAAGLLDGETYALDVGFITSGDSDSDGIVGSIDLCPNEYAGCNDQNGDGCIDQPDVDADADGIGRGACDCNDANAQIWSTPGQVRSVRFDSATAMAWLPPIEPGGAQPRYDVIRSGTPSDFMTGATCVESDDASGTNAAELATPATGQGYYYLVRTENSCAAGSGPLGISGGVYARVARNCP